MFTPKMNLIYPEIEPQDEKRRQKIIKTKKRLSRRWLFRFFVFILVLVIFFSTNIIFSQSGLITNIGKISFWEGIARLIIHKDKVLKGEIFDRINILILGMGGVQHEGPYLTDTIILASLKPSTNQIALLSIPRDLYVPIPDYGWQKINFANALGMARKKDGGNLASEVVSNVFDIPIHYWVRVDFNLFKEIIDQLGGVEIEVENSFIDNQFPAADFTFQTISFKKGWQIMDGETALRFVRSRHGTNGENSDFARAKRQQKLLLALKEKFEKTNFLAQPHKIYSFYKSFKNNLSTNLDLSQAIRLVKIVSQVPPENVSAKIIKDGPNGLLKSEITVQGAFILSPKSGDFKELALIAKNIFSQGEKIFGQKAIGLSDNLSSIAVKEKEEKIRIIILNGTYISGLAKQTSQRLEKTKFEITKIGNALQRYYQKTLIFQINSNISEKKTQTIEKEFNSFVKPSSELSADLRDIFINEPVDFLIILGKDNFS